MTQDYPLPHYAASIWCSGDRIMLAIPPRAGEARGHTLQFPNNAAGMTIILDILRERQREGYQPIGHKSAPVQYDVDAILRKMGGATVQITVVPPVRKVDAQPTLSVDDLDFT